MNFIEKIQQRLSEPLPGKEHQRLMAPALRGKEKPSSTSPTVACVLVLLFPKNDEWHLALMQRVPHEKDKHSGQISFPGGRLEESDSSLEFCALREAEEEVGVPIDDVTVIGQLSEMFIPVSNFQVYPFVGFVKNTPTFIPQPSEVQNIIEVPIEMLKDISNQKTIDYRVRKNIVLKNTPYFDFFGKMVWGATAMMLNEFRSVVLES